MDQVFLHFTREQYERLLVILEDRENFPDSHSVWLEVSKSFMENLARRHIRVYCQNIDPDELVAWCGLKGHKVNNASCLRFADHKFNQTLDSAPAHPRTVNYAPISSLYPDLVTSDTDNN